MKTVRDIHAFLTRFAPPSLAADWDNVGLLVGSLDRPVQRIMTCLTITPESADEAVRRKADLIVTHHPLPFRPIKRLTDETTPGRLLLQLVRHGIAIHSPHTAFDSALRGINRMLCDRLGMTNVQPLLRDAMDAELGSGRFGELTQPASLSDVISTIKDSLKVSAVQFVGERDRMIRRIGVACGSAGEFLSVANDVGCDLLLTGETSFHTCLEAKAIGVALVLAGHYASERFALDELAKELQTEFPTLEIWSSADETDPVQLS